MREAIEAIRAAIETSGKQANEVAQLCRQMFSRSRFSDLTESQQWTLIAALDPNAIGPYGCSMAPF
jgi:hypothetical protein